MIIETDLGQIDAQITESADPDSPAVLAEWAGPGRNFYATLTIDGAPVRARGHAMLDAGQWVDRLPGGRRGVRIHEADRRPGVVDAVSAAVLKALDAQLSADSADIQSAEHLRKRRQLMVLQDRRERLLAQAASLAAKMRAIEGE